MQYLYDEWRYVAILWIPIQYDQIGLTHDQVGKEIFDFMVDGDGVTHDCYFIMATGYIC